MYTLPTAIYYTSFTQQKPLPWKTNSQQAVSLAFSSSTSLLSLQEFFNSARKQEADPNQFIKPRSFHEVANLAVQGRITMIKDQHLRIQAIAVGYSHSLNDTPKKPQMITEIGTVLSCIKGWSLSEFTIAALAEKIKTTEGSGHQIVAKVTPSNKAANKFFEQTLGWDIVTQSQKISVYYNSEMGASARHEERSAPKNWYRYGHDAQAKARSKLERTKNIGSITDQNDNIISFEM